MKNYAELKGQFKDDIMNYTMHLYSKVSFMKGYEDDEQLSYGELAVIDDIIKNRAKIYGMITELKENGIIF